MNTTATTGITPNILAEIKVKKPEFGLGGLTARPPLITSDRPSYMEKVPSVTMIEGRRSSTASSPLISPSPAPTQMPITVAIQDRRRPP